MDQNQNSDGRIPLGLCKQAYMKFESALGDIYEIQEDEDLEPDEKQVFAEIADCLSLFMAHIVNLVSKEIGEEEFLNETIPMDEVGTYPGDEEPDDLMDAPVE